MSYNIEGVDCETNEEGYLLDANFSDAACLVIAAAEGITLGAEHWEVINYLREKYQEDGHSPNFRTMLKELSELNPELDNKKLYELFPVGPAKQGAKIAGLPQPYGKGGY